MAFSAGERNLDEFYLKAQHSADCDASSHLAFFCCRHTCLPHSYGVDVSIKWPNDLFVAGRKVCGILTEVRAEADRVH